MNRWIGILILAAAGGAIAQAPQNTEWLGVWHAELDGQPSVVLTLADDTGALGGTVVLNLLEKEKGGVTHVARTEPHTLVNPHVDGNVLAFQCKKPDGELLNFAAKRDSSGEVTFHCLNCGAGAPTVSLTRTN